MPKTDPIDLDPTLDPWQQQPGETGTWFSRFCRYKLLDSSRSRLATYLQEWQEKQAPDSHKKPPKWVPGSWKEASAKYRWQERAEAWDYHYYSQQEHKFLVRWEEHRQKLLEKSQQLLKVADEMLQYPLTTQQVDEDGQTTIVKPANWSFRDIPTYYEKATDLLRVAVGDDEWMIRQLQRRGYIVARTEEEADALAEGLG